MLSADLSLPSLCSRSLCHGVLSLLRFFLFCHEAFPSRDFWRDFRAQCLCGTCAIQTDIYLYFCSSYDVNRIEMVELIVSENFFQLEFRCRAENKSRER
jgi:hypothetical protein